MSTTSPLRRVLRRIAVTAAGTLVVAAGVAMLVLPGPGLVTIVLGLSRLGREHAWAAALETRARARVVATARRVRGRPPTPVRPLPCPRRAAPTGEDEAVDRAA